MNAPFVTALHGRRVHQANRAAFLSAYGAVFEHSPWVIERAWSSQPFADAAALHAAFLRVLAGAKQDERIALARAHPELADRTAIATGLTEYSAREQSGAGLDRLSPAEYAAFHALNHAYRARFGFPFIICVRLHDKTSILEAMRRRLNNDADAELREAVTQIGLIGALRLSDIPEPAEG